MSLARPPPDSVGAYPSRRRVDAREKQAACRSCGDGRRQRLAPRYARPACALSPRTHAASAQALRLRIPRQWRTCMVRQPRLVKPDARLAAGTAVGRATATSRLRSVAAAWRAPSAAVPCVRPLYLPQLRSGCSGALLGRSALSGPAHRLRPAGGAAAVSVRRAALCLRGRRLRAPSFHLRRAPSGRSAIHAVSAGGRVRPLR